MTARYVRHLPVSEGSCFVGLVSVGAVVKAIILEKQRLVDRLHDHLTRTYGRVILHQVAIWGLLGLMTEPLARGPT
jgi:hypothetical protein